MLGSSNDFFLASSNTTTKMNDFVKLPENEENKYAKIAASVKLL